MTEHAVTRGERPGEGFGESLGHAERLLASVFGHPGFRPGQEDVVRSVLGGRDTLAVMPTGGGKSLCYQVPALLSDGLTLVVCPLVSLMKDQREALIAKLGAAERQRSCDREVAALHSGLTPEDRRRVEGDVLSGAARILFVAPERLRSLRFCLLLKRRGVSLVVVDEAHCVSEWGHSFRHEYLFVGEAAKDLTNPSGERPPILALTATADRRVRADVVRLLGLKDHAEISTGFDRPNLSYSVLTVGGEAGRLPAVLEGLRSSAAAGALPAVVYAHTRRQTEELAADVRAANLPGIGPLCAAYHAGMPSGERDAVQERFMGGELPVICATIAFGMGIDKPDIRTVLHATLPSSLPSYVQEAGRAGRDGRDASCTVLFSEKEMGRRRELASRLGTPLPDALAYFDALRRRAMSDAPGQGSEGTIRLSMPASELFGLADLEAERAQDAFRALEAIGRVKRRYNLWGSVRIARPRPVWHHHPQTGAASRILGALDRMPSATIPLAELAVRAEVATVTAQVLLTKLSAEGLIEARGAGADLADVLVKPEPLTRAEIAALGSRLDAPRQAALAHLDDIELYASGAYCRRQRIIDHFEGEGVGPRVAPCGGCDVCRGQDQDHGHHNRSPRRGLLGRLGDLLGGLIHVPDPQPERHPAGGLAAASAHPRASNP